MLAEATTTQTTGGAVGLLERLSALQLPTQSEFVNEYLTAAQAVQASLLVACGLVYLLQGWKMFKLLVVANAGTLGAILGFYFGGRVSDRANMPIFGAVAGGLLLAAVAWPCMRYAISLMGGLAGSILGFLVWRYVADTLQRPKLNEYAWAGALIGLITLGLLAFLVFRLVVMVFTSLQGSLMSVSGVVALLLKYEPIREDLKAELSSNMHLLPLLIAVPALIGFTLQYAAAAGKARKKRRAMEGGD